jgi:hypothetical protein
MGDLTDIETWGMTTRPSHVVLASAAGSVHNVCISSTRVLQRDFTFNKFELLKLWRILDLIQSTLLKLRGETSLELLQAYLPETPGLLSPLKVINNVHR